MHKLLIFDSTEMFSYSFYTGGAHPNLTQSAFNFLIPDGSRVFLPDLVGSAGVKLVSDIAIGNLDAQLTRPNGMSDPNWIRTGAGPKADNFEAFVPEPKVPMPNVDRLMSWGVEPATAAASWGVGTTTSGILALVIKCWNAYRTGETIEYLRWTNTGRRRADDGNKRARLVLPDHAPG